MFGRLLIKLGLKKKPVARLGSVGRLQAAAAGSMSARGPVMTSRTTLSREKPRQQAPKPLNAGRRPNLDDDGFPQTMISSFHDSEPTRSRSFSDDEKDVPIPFRSHGGGDFGGGGASASWGAKPSAAASCWVGASDTGASVGSGGSSSSRCSDSSSSGDSGSSS
jgi:hypothetical protein